MERVKLSYSSPLRRVKVAVLPEHCQKGDELAKKMIQRAKAKCEAEQRAGRLAVYQVYDNEFLQLCQALRTSKHVSADEWTHFTLAQGGVPLSGLGIEWEAGQQFFKLSADLEPSDQNLLTWPNFLLNVRLALAELSATFPVHEGMLRSVYLSLKGGDKVLDLRAKFQMESSDEPRKPAFLVNAERQEAYLLLSQPEAFIDRDQIAQLMQRLESAYRKVKQKFPDARFHKDDVFRYLQILAKGPERLGVGLPKTILFANSPQSLGQDSGNTVNPVKQTAKPPASKEVKKNLGNWLLKFEIDESGLEARISEVNEYKLYNKPDAPITRDTLLKEMKRAGIKACYEPYLDKVLNLIARKSNLLGQIVAQGDPGAAGEDPYLHWVYREKPDKSLGELIEDVRSSQNRKLVESGQVIAEVRFRDGKPGKNIFGEVINILGHEDMLKIDIGEGVTVPRAGQLVAAIDGMPIVNGKTLSCSPIYIHKGDVNLGSGNISFDGSAEIHGNVESGSTVIVTGDLLIKGTIGRSFVRCGGDLEVQGGILGGSAAWVESGANMYAGFIENSKVAVSGNLEVRASILNSSVIVGGSLKMRNLKKGTIGGGYISVRNTMHTGHLGFEDGKKTVCRIGSDWHMERRIAIQESRKERLEQAHELERRNLENLQSRKVRTSEINKQIDQRTKRLNRIGLLIRKIDRKLIGLGKLVSWNRDAMAKVEEVIVKNIDLVVGGRQVVINEDMKAVMITYHKYRDSRVNPLEVISSYMKTRGGSDAAA